MSYELLLLCAKGPYAKRPPANWARIKEECPNIIRKVETQSRRSTDTNFIRSNVHYGMSNHCDRHRRSY